MSTRTVTHQQARNKNLSRTQVRIGELYEDLIKLDQIVVEVGEDGCAWVEKNVVNGWRNFHNVRDQLVGVLEELER